MYGVSQQQPSGLLVPQQPPQATIHQPITTPADVVQVNNFILLPITYHTFYTSLMEIKFKSSKYYY